MYNRRQSALGLVYLRLLCGSTVVFLLLARGTDFFTIFSSYESALGADDRSLHRFPICQGTLPWLEIN